MLDMAFTRARHDRIALLLRFQSHKSEYSIELCVGFKNLNPRSKGGSILLTKGFLAQSPLTPLPSLPGHVSIDGGTRKLCCWDMGRFRGVRRMM